MGWPLFDQSPLLRSISIKIIGACDSVGMIESVPSQALAKNTPWTMTEFMPV